METTRVENITLYNGTSADWIRFENMFASRCSHLSTILNNVVEPESGVTILFNIVDSYEQCGQKNIVQTCFHQ